MPRGLGHPGRIRHRARPAGATNPACWSIDRLLTSSATNYGVGGLGSTTRPPGFGLYSSVLRSGPRTGKAQRQKTAPHGAVFPQIVSSDRFADRQIRTLVLVVLVVLVVVGKVLVGIIFP